MGTGDMAAARGLHSPGEFVVVTSRTRRRSGEVGGLYVRPGWYVGVAIADWPAGRPE